MDTDEFWAVIDAVRADSLLADDALAAHLAALPADGVLDAVATSYRDTLIAHLAAFPIERICEFDEAHGRVRHGLYRESLWAAGYLIGGGCSDDAFMDFRNGLIALGRDWCERVLADPDELAAHPLVAAAAAREDDAVLFYEDAAYAPTMAFEVATGRPRDEYYELMDSRRTGPVATLGDAVGESFDFEDRAEMLLRMPRLTACFWPED